MKATLIALLLLATTNGYASLIEIERPIPLIALENTSNGTRELAIPVIIEKRLDDSHTQVRVADLNSDPQGTENPTEPFIVESELLAELNYRGDFQAVAGGLALFLVTQNGRDFDPDSGIMLRLGLSRGTYISAGFAVLGIIGAELATEYAYDAIEKQGKLGLTGRFNIMMFQAIIGTHYEFGTKDVTTFIGAGFFIPLSMLKD